MSINHVPPPPNPFKPAVNERTLLAGQQLHRIYSTKHPGNAFNPNHEKLNRFSPIFHRGEVVPVLYAGSTRLCAIYETLFHDAHLAKRRALPLKSIENKRYGAWTMQRPLTLASLHAPDLMQYGLTVDQLTATNSMYYAQTARWAEAIHQHHPHVHGLEWTSYRGGPGCAYILFGDRITRADLKSAGNEVSITADHDVYSEIIECGRRAGVRVHDSRL